MSAIHFSNVIFTLIPLALVLAFYCQLLAIQLFIQLVLHRFSGKKNL